MYQFVGNFEESIHVLEAEFQRDVDRQLSPLQRAGLFRRIGETLLKKGDLNEAIPYFDKGMAALGTVSGNQNMAEAAMLLERKGWNYFLEARLEEALQAGLEAQDR